MPTGIKFFNWIGTMCGGRISFETPMLFAIGMLLVFLIGGLSGVLQAMAPVDFSLTDTYFVVAHMHYVIMGVVMGAFAGVYYWFPKMTGKMLSERWGKVHFWCFFIGINVTFFVQHQLGLDGMPRRVATYREADGWGTLNLISTIGVLPHRDRRVGVHLEPAPLVAERRARGRRTRGVARRSSGRPPRRRRSTTSTRCRRSAPSARCGTCTRPRPRPRGSPRVGSVDAMMKAEARVFLGITAFFVLIGVIYWFTSYEEAGAVMLAASAGMGVVAGGCDPAALAGRPGPARGRPARDDGRGGGHGRRVPHRSRSGRSRSD